MRLYSEVGLGVSMMAFDGETDILPTIQATAFGITVGREVFLFAEYSVGTVCLGGKVGLGYRF